MSIEQYGRFIEEEGCFELTQEPPRKWANLHYNQIGEHEMYSEITNIGDGLTWVRDGQGCTCTLVNYDSKYLYIRDDEDNTTFCPWGQPTPQAVTDRKCRYYSEKTETSSTCAGMRVKQRVFVPRDCVFEAWTLDVENLSDRPREISVFAYAKFELSGCDGEGRPVGKDNYSEVLPEIGGVLVTNRNTETPTNRFNGYLITLNEFAGGTGYRDDFTRSDFGYGTPKILFGWNPENHSGFGPDCCGLVQVRLQIPPNGSVRADFLLGQTTGADEVKKIREKMTPEWLDELCEEQEAIAHIHAEQFTVRTGNKNYDGLMNTFVKKQIYSYLINKSGFRDNLQADAALALFDGAAAKDNLLRALGSQYADGSVPHGFRPFNRRQYADKPAWILLTVPALIAESGDFSLLEQTVPYFESTEKGSVFDHMLRTMRFLANDLGKNGLCDQHYADWNDSLAATQEAGDRESVMVTLQLCYGLLQMEALAEKIGDTAVQQEANALHRQFADRVNNVAWDSEWYTRTLCGDGYRIGSHTNKEGWIYLNTQSWAVLGGVADAERAGTCMNSVEKHLKHDFGYPICYPPYTQYDPRVGEVSNRMPGQSENGGCYCHGATFKGVADCMLGRAEEAWETFVKVCPDNPLNPVSRSRTEPFSFTNSYTTAKYDYGRAGYPWRTGTAGWMTVMLIEWILGARRHYDGLLIDPCLTKTIPHAKLKRTFRGAEYHIELDNSAGRCVGAQSIHLDGEKIEGNLLPVFDGGEHRVEVII